MIDGNTSRIRFYVSMQQPGLVCAMNALPNDTLEIQGQRVRAQPDSFWSYYPGDIGILCKRATSWNPQQSRITRENKDYMTALAKGLTRDDSKQSSSENGEVFSSRWHNQLSNNANRIIARPIRSGRIRPPTSAPERALLPFSTLVEAHRPTTAPVIVEGRAHRVSSTKIKSAVPPRPPPPPPPPAPILLRPPRVVDTSENFDNLTSASCFHLIDGVKPAIFKSDNHFVHQLCTNAINNLNDTLNTSSRDSFLDASMGTLGGESIGEKPQLNETSTSGQFEEDETNDDRDEEETPPRILHRSSQSRLNDVQHVANLGSWQRDTKTGRIEAISNNILHPKKDSLPPSDPAEVERRLVEQEEEQLNRRQHEIDRFSFDAPIDLSVPAYEFKSPFPDDYFQALTTQSQQQTFNNGGTEWNLRDFYRDIKTPFEPRTNSKAVFERCLKLARLQSNTIKWEQRRRQNLTTYNRLMRGVTLETTSTYNLNGSVSSGTKTNNSSEKETRELNELKRDLRCGECKRVTCLGNCAPGQDYHLYKRLVSSIPPPSSRQPPSTAGGSNTRDQTRCKHGCVTCTSGGCRTTTADIINANAIITSSNTGNNSSITRLRSSKATFSFGQRAQRPSADLRPRSMHQVTRDIKLKFEQANLSPVVVVPLFEDDQSSSTMGKRTLTRATNGLVPGKSFRSQRRDSLSIVPQEKVSS